MERNVTENTTEKERERNDWSEDPRSRTERNDFKKVGTCPALASSIKENIEPGLLSW